MTTLSETKFRLRSDIRRQTRALPAETLRALSETLMLRVETHPRVLRAHTLLLYHSLPDEPCTHALIHRLSATKHILLPVVCGDELELRTYRPDRLRPGAFHILEPEGEAFTDTAAIDLVLVPGVAFTIDGRRMGRGRGYYDRLLARPELSAAYRLGVCFPHQCVADLPTEPHDIRMNEVLHE